MTVCLHVPLARISNEALDRLKREVSLVRLVESFGIKLKKHGKDYLALCPFHACRYHRCMIRISGCSVSSFICALSSVRIERQTTNL